MTSTWSGSEALLGGLGLEPTTPSVSCRTPDSPPATPVDMPESADVVVVGPGITGLTTATLLAERGVDVVLVERNPIGTGSSGRTTAKRSARHGTLGHRIRSEHGTQTLRDYVEAKQAGLDIVAELGASSSVLTQRRDAWTYATERRAQAPRGAQRSRAGHTHAVPAAHAAVRRGHACPLLPARLHTHRRRAYADRHGPLGDQPDPVAADIADRGRERPSARRRGLPRDRQGRIGALRMIDTDRGRGHARPRRATSQGYEPR